MECEVKTTKDRFLPDPLICQLYLRATNMSPLHEFLFYGRADPAPTINFQNIPKGIPKLIVNCYLLPVNCYRIPVTTPAPTVLPPSRIANLKPSSIAIGVISLISIWILSPGITISVPAGRSITPVTSVVLK